MPSIVKCTLRFFSCDFGSVPVFLSWGTGWLNKTDKREHCSKDHSRNGGALEV